MSTRYALTLTQEVLDMAAKITGGEPLDLENQKYFMVIEQLEIPREFKATFMTLDELAEEMTEDDTLEIIA
jgi:hypothetical protein